MPKLSNKERGLHLVALWLDEDKYQQIKMAADSVQEPVTGWIRRAVYSSLRHWVKPKANTQLFEVCTMCNKRHDPKEHFHE